MTSLFDKESNCRETSAHNLKGVPTFKIGICALVLLEMWVKRWNYGMMKSQFNVGNPSLILDGNFTSGWRHTVSHELLSSKCLLNFLWAAAMIWALWCVQCAAEQRVGLAGYGAASTKNKGNNWKNRKVSPQPQFLTGLKLSNEKQKERVTLKQEKGWLEGKQNQWKWTWQRIRELHSSINTDSYFWCVGIICFSEEWFTSCTRVRYRTEMR